MNKFSGPQVTNYLHTDSAPLTKSFQTCLATPSKAFDQIKYDLKVAEIAIPTLSTEPIK